MKKISTQNYKGVRDFYPKDWLFQKWLFWKMSEVCEKYGYENYNASPLEYTELFEAKSGREIVENETYNLTDRGGREVTIRPEMTPTVARMIAAKNREIPRPIRWYSMPNLFRYEKPQKGRLREHYQLNVDIFGVETEDAEVEVLSLGYDIMKNLGAQDSMFKILINNRKIINKLFEKFCESKEQVYELSKIIDKKAKLSAKDFQNSVEKILKERSLDFIEIIEKSTLENCIEFAEKSDIENTQNIINSLKNKGVSNAEFDLTLMRGFDYYTDTVFEFFDTNPDNNRSMFGGGRYDDLLDIFEGAEKVPAFGFGMGDVTARDFLESHDLMPNLQSMTKLYIAIISSDQKDHANQLAQYFRENNINTEVDYTFRKTDRQVNSAENKKIEFCIVIGENETSTEKYNLKNLLENKEEKSLRREDILNNLTN